MSTARFLLALACCCTSAGAAAATGDSALELELELAREPALYLRLDLDVGALEVMVRGVELDRAEVAGARLVTSGGSVHELPQLPAVWRIAADPEAQWRRVVAPPTLVPYQEDAEPTPPTGTPTPAELPDQYHVQLDNGWTLHLGADPPAGRWDRLAARLASGWRRLTGRSVEPAPPAVVLEIDPDDARRLLHVLRAGTAVLVLCDPATP